MKELRVWATACSHIHSDLKEGRLSIAEPIAQSEFGGTDGGPPFEWDIMLHLGDTHPDDHFGNKTHVEKCWGTTFVNVSALTRHHARKKRPLFPMSRLFTFIPGSNEVRIQCYLHTTDYSNQGWYAPAERTVKLTKAFR